MNKISEAGPVAQPPHPVPKIRIAKDGTPTPMVSDPGGYDQWFVDLAKAFGTENSNTAVMMLQQALNACDFGSSKDNREIIANTIISLMAEINPQSSSELMLGVQMTAVHFQAMRLMQLAGNSKFPEANSKLINLASRLMRTFTQQLETLRKFRQRGRQKMTVEHVHVHEGGQAIVGNVENHPGGRAK